jgi:hypothetical protein
MKLESFCKAKDKVNKTNQQPTYWKNIFTNLISNRRLISNVYKEFNKLTSKKNKQTNNTIKKWDIELNIKCSKEMFKVLSDQRNANQNNPEIPTYNNQNS